jgi:hypothetical protein
VLTQALGASLVAVPPVACLRVKLRGRVPLVSYSLRPLHIHTTTIVGAAILLLNLLLLLSTLCLVLFTVIVGLLSLFIAEYDTSLSESLYSVPFLPGPSHPFHLLLHKFVL